MRRAPSALVAIGGFGVAAASLGVAVTGGAVLLMPDPPATRVTVADAAAVLRGGPPPSGLERRDGPPPDGPRALFVEDILASTLGSPATSVRAVWLEPGPVRVAASRGASVPRLPDAAAKALKVMLARQGGTGGVSVVLRPRQGGWFEALAPGAAAAADARVAAALRSLPQPAFAAGVQGADGRWVSVAPHTPFFSGWRLKLLAALGASLLLVAPLAWLFGRRLTRPFRALADAVERGDDMPPTGGPRELRDAGAAIVALRQRLAAEADERMRMLVAVAHDLRTPLTSLALRIEGVPEPRRGRMVAEVERMGAMIRDVLEFARAAGSPHAPVALRPLVEEVLFDVPNARDAVTLSAGPDPLVSGDREALRRAVENLVRNALNYADEAAVVLSDSEKWAEVRVLDRGPGIPAEDRERLTRPFERGDASRSRDTGGVGLGLSIVRGVAEAHGGALMLQDTAGGGVTAVLRLPTHRAIMSQRRTF